MPIIHPSSYSGSPRWQRGGHAQTIVPGAMRRLPHVAYHRERITTPDDDFLDLDWVRPGFDRLVIITHGLEGSSYSQYALGAAHFFSHHGWDALAWNCRSCSGEMNRQFRLYHHGDTEDIGTVVEHALATGRYQKIALIGFSMGGNITIKYFGVKGEDAPREICAGVAFSSPTDIRAAANALDNPRNWIYKKRFLGLLSKKIKAKAEMFPGRIEVGRLREVRAWRDFDEWFSAPLNGYANAEAFYIDASARNFIDGIRTPMLLVNAQNDPILEPTCSPLDIAEAHPYFFLETPEHGGHCGFSLPRNRVAWSELRAFEFCATYA